MIRHYRVVNIVNTSVALKLWDAVKNRFKLASIILLWSAAYPRPFFNFTQNNMIYPTHFIAALSTLNVGRSSGSYCQQEFISRKREAGHSGGRARRSPFSIRLMTSSFLIPTKGFTPLIKISQQQTPNIQTSLRPVNRRKLILSGAIHLMGSLPLEAAKRNKKRGGRGKEIQTAGVRDGTVQHPFLCSGAADRESKHSATWPKQQESKIQYSVQERYTSVPSQDHIYCRQ